ncbi:MAG: N-methylhydantoinase [Actinomycetota bacterium]|nr:N-methylhydantoinase [Actinomycetota bacterium]
MADGLVVCKVPTTPDDQSEGFDLGLREALEQAGDPAPSLIAHGTTVATNAVLERRGALTALVTTEGFADLLVIGRQNRPSLYDLWADRPEPLVPRALAAGVGERVGPSGEVLTPLDEDGARDVVAALLDAGAESLAVCLLFSFANPAHERRIAALARDLSPTVRVSLSCDVSPEFREYERASTVALDAYVGPVVERYLDRIRTRSASLGAGVVVMRSGGATMTLEEAVREPVNTLLSGPAAGVRGAVLVAGAAGMDDLVTFDMGGTSTDVCLVEGGEPALAAESSIGGLPFRTPAVAVHTVGAGGGSLLWIDPAGALRAGPASAGAVPGPASYGRGGTEPTVTDAHVVLGHLRPDGLLAGRLPLDTYAARKAFDPLASALGVGVEEVAAAGIAAVEAQMAKAIRVVTVERGRDPRDLTLVAFGGAGPMHATAIAAGLEVSTVLVPLPAGVLSALGLLTAPQATDVALTRPMRDPDPADVAALLAGLSDRASELLAHQGAERASVQYRIDCRYAGQAHEVPVAVAAAPDLSRVATDFAAAHRARYGWDAEGEPVELVTFRVRAAGPEPRLRLPDVPPGGGARPLPGTAGYLRADLGAGDRFAGPCLVWGDDATVVVDEGWDAEVDRHGSLILRARGGTTPPDKGVAT